MNEYTVPIAARIIKGLTILVIVWLSLIGVFILGGCSTARGTVSVPADAVQEG